MKFDDIDKKMRVFETMHDICIIPGIYIVARLDGRNFTRLTKDTLNFDAPFDKHFCDLMVKTVIHLMNCGFNIIYGCTFSDEISLLFNPNEDSFQRKERKLNSILAGEASAKFSLLSNSIGVFDCRLCLFPNQMLIIDYFRWRSEDAHRNALNSHCYWALRKEGLSSRKATKALMNTSISEKNELLFQRNINFNDLPDWQKRGVGIYWEEYEKEAIDLKTEKSVKVKKNG